MYPLGRELFAECKQEDFSCFAIDVSGYVVICESMLAPRWIKSPTKWLIFTSLMQCLTTTAWCSVVRQMSHDNSMVFCGETDVSRQQHGVLCDLFWNWHLLLLSSDRCAIQLQHDVNKLVSTSGRINVITKDLTQQESARDQGHCGLSLPTIMDDPTRVRQRPGSLWSESPHHHG
ncbi:hypothetical protein LSAT2_020748 [Lamellibrachia satsuma]|nr:hypothetical protein LSAT2_020748 [Lamellibrachia satsuma]